MTRSRQNTLRTPIVFQVGLTGGHRDRYLGLDRSDESIGRGNSTVIGLIDGSSANNPLGGLSSGSGNDVEIGVVVKHGEPMFLAGSRDQ